MSISVVSGSAYSSIATGFKSGQTSYSFTVPKVGTDGNLLLLSYWASNQNNPNDFPASSDGWTAVPGLTLPYDGNNNGYYYLYCYYKVASSETGTYTIDFGKAAPATLQITYLEVSGQDASSPFDVQTAVMVSGSSGWGGTQPQLSSITPTDNGCLVVGQFFSTGLPSPSTSLIVNNTGFTNQSSANSSTTYACTIATAVQSTAAATGYITFGPTQSTYPSYWGFTLAIKPSAAPSNLSTLVQSAFGSSGTAGNNATATFSAAPTPGNLLIAIWRTVDSSGANTDSTTISGFTSIVQGLQYQTGTSQFLNAAFLVVPSSPASAYTVTVNSTERVQVDLFEFSWNGTTPVISTPETATGSGYTVNLTALTTSQSSLAIACAATSAGNYDSINDSSFTQIDGGNGSTVYPTNPQVNAFYNGGLSGTTVSPLQIAWNGAPFYGAAAFYIQPPAIVSAAGSSSALSGSSGSSDVLRSLSGFAHEASESRAIASRLLEALAHSAETDAATGAVSVLRGVRASASDSGASTGAGERLAAAHGSAGVYGASSGATSRVAADSGTSAGSSSSSARTARIRGLSGSAVATGGAIGVGYIIHIITVIGTAAANGAAYAAAAVVRSESGTASAVGAAVNVASHIVSAIGQAAGVGVSPPSNAERNARGSGESAATSSAFARSSVARWFRGIASAIGASFGTAGIAAPPIEVIFITSAIDLDPYYIESEIRDGPVYLESRL